ncbi:MAG: hypothetical protein JSW67_09940 [Candidatus Latescibacterota bacterium]|nr:MAG: hypothetical protein JSW67_09940 [Candidatus Latescibacterota bacterium]
MHEARFWIIAALAALALLAFLLLRRVSPRWLLPGAVVLGLATALGVRSDSLAELTQERLTQARERWSRHAPADYVLELQVHADRLENAHFHLRVRDGEVLEALQNGSVRAARADAYTVAGLFDILERELELALDPSSGFGAPAGYRAYLKARFDPDYGYPLRYRRSVGGTSNAVEITVLRFVPEFEAD